MTDATLIDKDAEEHVLGAMMISQKAVNACLPELSGEHFYYQSYGLIFETMRSMNLAGVPIDVITLTNAMEKNGSIEQAGGKMKLTELALLVPAAGNAHHYAKIVRSKASQRILASFLAEVHGNVIAGNAPEETLIALETGLIDLRGQIEEGRSSIVSAYSMAEYLDDKIKNPLPEETGITPPWSFLSQMLGGRLYVLGGYQADGKTVAAVHFVRAAAEQGKRVGFVSMEMPWRDVADRYLATFGVTASRIYRGNVEDGHQRSSAEHGISRIAGWNADVIDDPAADTVDIRRYQKLGRYEMLVIDHLHRFRTRAEYRRQDIEAIITDLVNLAREEHIPILLLAQLRRAGSTDKSFPRPSMASIRETAMIEAEAAMVWFIWRERDDRQLPTERVEWITAKNRYGPTGVNELFFHEETLRLTEVAHNNS